MIALVLGLLLAGVSDEDFDLTVQGLARQQGCELQAVLETEGGDVRLAYFTCPERRIGVLWARGANGWEIVGKLTAPYPPVRGESGI